METADASDDRYSDEPTSGSQSVCAILESSPSMSVVGKKRLRRTWPRGIDSEGDAGEREFPDQMRKYSPSAGDRPDTPFVSCATGYQLLPVCDVDRPGAYRPRRR